MIRKSWLRAVVGTAVTAGAAGLVLSVGSAQASTGTSGGTHIVSTLTPERPGPAGSVSPAALEHCVKPSRTAACEGFTLKTVVTDHGAPTGLAYADIVIVWRTEIKSRHFTGEVFVDTTFATGNVVGLTQAITTECGGTCVGTGEAIGPESVRGQSFRGTLHYTDQTPILENNKPIITATPTMPAPGQGTSASIRASVDIRCDNLFKPQAAGCVNKNFVPTMTTMAGLPEIAKNIAHVQEHTHLQLGRPGGHHPLHRGLPGLRRRNYNAVCAKQKPPHGKKKGKNGVSCDEYPFASTAEGGTTVPRTERAIAWVPTWEQNSQGGRINAFYTQFRVLPADEFDVQV